MRSRRPYNPWPAIADTMMIVAIGLASLLLKNVDREDIEESLRTENERLISEVRTIKPEKDRLAQEVADLQRERAKNEDMFKAIQTSEELVQDLQSRLKLPKGAWGTDQSLRFGDDLIHFRSGDSNVIWQPNGRELMRDFCSTLSELLDRPFKEGSPAKRSEFFTVIIEGHTDSELCDGSDRCNWYLSGQRAASVRAEMLKPSVCPGGAGWNLIPMAMAASKPQVKEVDAASRQRNRRIELRVVPNYSEIISRPSGEAAEDQVRLPSIDPAPVLPAPVARPIESQNGPAAPAPLTPKAAAPPRQATPALPPAANPPAANPPAANPRAETVPERTPPQEGKRLRVGRFPETSLRPIPPNSLSTLSAADLTLMGNEIYARHGQIFTAGGRMNRHFQKQRWYTPSVSNVLPMLSALEQSNIAIIQAELARRTAATSAGSGAE